MAGALRSSRVSMQQIDMSDTTFSLTPSSARRPSPALLESISRCGILHPPILRENRAGAYQVVAGRLRLMAINEIQPALSHTCLLLADGTPEIESLAINLEDTLLRGRISTLEQAIFFKKALQWIGEPDAARDFLPLLGYKPSPRIIRELIKLLDLEDPLQQGVHDGLLHEGVARDLLLCSFPERLALFEIIETLGLSVGSQKKLLACCRELALRHRMSMIGVLAEPRLKEILHNQEANAPQKGANILRILTEMCSPRLTEAEQEHRSFVGKLMLPQGVSVEHAPAFEKDILSLAIQFKNRAELLSCWPAIRKAIS